MRDARRDIQTRMIGGGQVQAVPLEARRRILPQVHGHIKNVAHGASHQLVLPMRIRLVVHTAQGASTWIARNAALVPFRKQAVRGEFFIAGSAGKSSAFVREHDGSDFPHSGQWCWRKNHGHTFNSGTAVTKRPPQSRIFANCAVISSPRFHGRMST